MTQAEMVDLFVVPLTIVFRRSLEEVAVVAVVALVELTSACCFLDVAAFTNEMIYSLGSVLESCLIT